MMRPHDHQPDDKLLSAYLDGEVPERFRPAIEQSLAENPSVAARYARLVRVHEMLERDVAPEIGTRVSSGYAEVIRRISVRPVSFRRWVTIGARWSTVRISLPALAAGVAAVVFLAGALVWSNLRVAPATAADYLAQGENVDVTIRVDDADMERVLQWLADKDMLGEINIQLPEQQFSIVGEPVLLKPGEGDPAVALPERASE